MGYYEDQLAWAEANGLDSERRKVKMIAEIDGKLWKQSVDFPRVVEVALSIRPQPKLGEVYLVNGIHSDFVLYLSSNNIDDPDSVRHYYAPYWCFIGENDE